jgi:hypothetical protein
MNAAMLSPRPWSMEAIWAGYHINGYRISDADGNPVARTSVEADAIFIVEMASRATQAPDVGEVDWRGMYRLQTAMRFMDNNASLTKEAAYRMADQDVASLERTALQATQAPANGVDADRLPQAGDRPHLLAIKGKVSPEEWAAICAAFVEQDRIIKKLRPQAPASGVTDADANLIRRAADELFACGPRLRQTARALRSLAERIATKATLTPASGGVKCPSCASQLLYECPGCSDGNYPLPQEPCGIDAMVSRFLGWKLPDDFAPDGGISFDGRADLPWPKNEVWPTGTNLLNDPQARAMFAHCLPDDDVWTKERTWTPAPASGGVTVETVGFIRRRRDGDRELYIDWTLEGEISSLEVGEELIVSTRKITDDTGAGEVFLQAPDVEAVELTVCCGREECGGECGNEWRGTEWVRKAKAPDVGRLVEKWRADADSPPSWNNEDRGYSNALYRCADELRAALEGATHD